MLSSTTFVAVSGRRAEGLEESKDEDEVKKTCLSAMGLAYTAFVMPLPIRNVMRRYRIFPSTIPSDFVHETLSETLSKDDGNQ